MLSSGLTNAIEQFMVYVHRNEAHFTYICVGLYHTNVFEADNIYKKPPPNVISPKKNLILYRSGVPPMTLLTAGAPTDPQLLSSTASNVCTTLQGGWRRPDGPPNKNPGYAGVLNGIHQHIIQKGKLMLACR